MEAWAWGDTDVSTRVHRWSPVHRRAGVEWGYGSRVGQGCLLLSFAVNSNCSIFQKCSFQVFILNVKEPKRGNVFKS